MRKQIVMVILIVGIIIPFLIGTTEINAETNQRGTTGNIVRNEELATGYFPTTDLIIDLTNLSRNTNYGVLIGANQNITDQEWYNFTATKRNVQIKTTHFTGQGTQVNISGQLVNIGQLEIRLYGILNDEDLTPTLLDTYWLKIHYFTDQIPSDAIPVILSAIIIMGALTGIFLTVFKYLNN
ncbi:MAG: hypothetical protein ACW990_00175 [Promethearchaeota archaeon]|jgi:hypothetical protein